MSLSKDEYRKLQLVQEIRQQRVRLCHEHSVRQHSRRAGTRPLHSQDFSAQDHSHASAQIAETLPDRVDPDAPLPQRLSTFVRLHPVFSGAVIALLTYRIGPTRLLRVGRYLLPLFSGCASRNTPRD